MFFKFAWLFYILTYLFVILLIPSYFFKNSVLFILHMLISIDEVFLKPHRMVHFNLNFMFQKTKDKCLLQCFLSSPNLYFLTVSSFHRFIFLSYQSSHVSKKEFYIFLPEIVDVLHQECPLSTQCAILKLEDLQ